MNLIDTHSHIYSEEFDEDRAAVIERATTIGVSLILLPAIDPDSHSRQELLAQSRPDLFRQMMGLHPTSVTQCYDEPLNETRQLLFATPEKYIGVGEIGLDFYWDTTYKQQQIEVLEEQFRWAEELDKPVVLHLRNGKEVKEATDAYREVFHILEHHTNLRGIMHCFSGTLEDAQRAVAMGFLLGIGGVVTYKKSTLPTIVENTPLEKIVLETDSPYLAPVPYRGKRNESSYVATVAQKVADIKQTTIEHVGEVTSSNARTLFAI